MVQIIRVREKPELFIRLRRIEQTEACWIFTFADVVNRFEQTVMMPKSFEWEAMESVWEDLHRRWMEVAKEKEWARN